MRLKSRLFVLTEILYIPTLRGVIVFFLCSSFTRSDPFWNSWYHVKNKSLYPAVFEAKLNDSFSCTSCQYVVIPPCVTKLIAHHGDLRIVDPADFFERVCIVQMNGLHVSLDYHCDHEYRWLKLEYLTDVDFTLVIEEEVLRRPGDNSAR